MATCSISKSAVNWLNFSSFQILEFAGVFCFRLNEFSNRATNYFGMADIQTDILEALRMQETALLGVLETVRQAIQTILSTQTTEALDGDEYGINRRGTPVYESSPDRAWRPIYIGRHIRAGKKIEAWNEAGLFETRDHPDGIVRRDPQD